MTNLYSEQNTFFGFLGLASLLTVSHPIRGYRYTVPYYIYLYPRTSYLTVSTPILRYHTLLYPILSEDTVPFIFAIIFEVIDTWSTRLAAICSRSTWTSVPAPVGWLHIRGEMHKNPASKLLTSWPFVKVPFFCGSASSPQRRRFRARSGCVRAMLSDGGGTNGK